MELPPQPGNEPKITESQAVSLLKRKLNTYPKLLIAITPQEEKMLEAYLDSADEETIERVREEAENELLYLAYSRNLLTPEEMRDFERKMQENRNLRNYIETEQAQELTLKYIAWRQDLSRLREGEVRSPAYLEMTHEEIRRFLYLLDAQPDAVDTYLRMAGFTLPKKPGDELKLSADIFENERLLLLDLRDYIQEGFMSSKRKSEFQNILIEDERFRGLVQRFEEALREKE